MSEVDLKEVISHLGQIRVPTTPRRESLVGKVASPSSMEEIAHTEELGRRLELACKEAHVAMIRLVALREEYELQHRLMWSRVSQDVPSVDSAGYYSVNPKTGEVYELEFSQTPDAVSGILPDGKLN